MKQTRIVTCQFGYQAVNIYNSMQVLYKDACFEFSVVAKYTAVHRRRKKLQGAGVCPLAQQD